MLSKVILAVITSIIFATTIGLTSTNINTSAFIDPSMDDRKAPVEIEGENMYFAWWTNNTANGNEEVMFRASTDGGQTFGNKVNLSNTTDADSTRAEIDAEEENVVVSWWETNQTNDIPVARISNDAGQTFGPLLQLASNGTIGNGT